MLISEPENEEKISWNPWTSVFYIRNSLCMTQVLCVDVLHMISEKLCSLTCIGFDEDLLRVQLLHLVWSVLDRTLCNMTLPLSETKLPHKCTLSSEKSGGTGSRWSQTESQIWCHNTVLFCLKLCIEDVRETERQSRIKRHAERTTLDLRCS